MTPPSPVGRCRVCEQLSTARYDGVCEICSEHFAAERRLAEKMVATREACWPKTQPAAPPPGGAVESVTLGASVPPTDPAPAAPHARGPGAEEVAQAEADLAAARLLQTRIRLSHVTDAEKIADALADAEGGRLSLEGETALRRVRGIVAVVKRDLERELSSILGGAS